MRPQQLRIAPRRRLSLAPYDPDPPQPVAAAARPMSPRPAARQGRARWRLVGLWGGLLLLTAVGAQAQPWAGILSPARTTTWANPGAAGGMAHRTTLCATLHPGASAAQINSALAACPSGQVVFLTAGTYTLSAGLTFGSKSNVTLRGAGADQTLLQFSNGSSCEGLPSTICLKSAFVNNQDPQNATTWTAGYAVGTTVITVGSTAGMHVGGILILDQLNDSADSGGIFVCSATSCTKEGGNWPGRPNRRLRRIGKGVGR